MKVSIQEMIDKMKAKVEDIAKASNTTAGHIYNSISRDRQVVELKDGSYISVRSDSVFYKNPKK